MQKYLDEAEEDKKRYIEELKIYQQSEQYQAFMKRQTAKKMKGIVGKAKFEQYAVAYSHHTTQFAGSFISLPQKVGFLSSTFGETIDQPEPISFFPRSLLGGVMKDTGTGTRFHTMSLMRMIRAD